MEATQTEADAILRRAGFRLVPLILAMYIASFLNRVNAGFAALTMNHDLGFSPEVYGWGVGAFFWGYFLLEVPSNLIMEKVGARLWLSRIMVTWAVISMANALVQGPVSFFAVRFLLGVAFPFPTSSARPCRAGCWAWSWMACMAGNGCTSWKAFPLC